MACEISSSSVVITPQALLQHWQGHRRLTRRLIEAFPEEELFRFSLGGMRPFSVLAMEFIKMAVPTLRGVISGGWKFVGATAEPTTRAQLLWLWDETTEEINQLWPRILPHRFQEMDTAFGQSEGPVSGLLLYVIENEIHHRDQGYVYLRSLGIEPPAFY
ncbi:MAG: DinB family protein [Gemmatimonadota bacterium]|nr:DinB family protein [Gemmatimonadota bacterium]